MRKTLLSVLSQEQFDVTNDNISVTNDNMSATNNNTSSLSNVNNSGSHGNQYPLETGISSSKPDSYTAQHSGLNKYYSGGTGSSLAAGMTSSQHILGGTGMSQHSSSAAQRLNFDDIPVPSRLVI